MGSLQEALLKNGLAEDRPKPNAGPRKGRETRPDRAPKVRPAKPKPRKGAGKVAGTAALPGREKSDLERAWAARKRAEAAEKERVKLARVADQEARRKRNLELDAIVEGKALNLDQDQDQAELPRYFEHLGRIRRVLCTPQQRHAINAGELGVVNLRGRYLIVEPSVLEAYRALAADLVPDLSGKEPEAEASGDYPPVPDDITW